VKKKNKDGGWGMGDGTVEIAVAGNGQRPSAMLCQCMKHVI
jgi:hypothetical protein